MYAGHRAKSRRGTSGNVNARGGGRNYRRFAAVEAGVKMSVIGRAAENAETISATASEQTALAQRRSLGHTIGLYRLSGVYVCGGLVLLFGLWVPGTFLTA